jgi:putative DNA primase/helicase
LAARPKGGAVKELARTAFDGQALRVIQHVAGESPETADKILEILAADLVVWAGRLCLIHRLEAPSSGWIARPAGSLLLHQADATHLAELATRRADHRKWDRRANDFLPCDCPRRIGEQLLARGHWPGVRELLGVVEAPLVLPDGRLLDRAGFDVASGLYLAAVPDGYTSPEPEPGSGEVDQAVDVLLDAVSTFPFASWYARSAAMAAILAALLRRVLPAAPLVAITAPTPGTGKSLLADVVSVVAIGRPGAVLALGADEAETEKRLYAALLAGDQMIVLDNLEAPLRGAVVCQVVTQPAVRFRPLGGSGMVTVPTNAMVIVTGNNVDLRGDVIRRAMPIHLDAECERPDQRTFARDALAHTFANRGPLIRAALTIVRAYLAAGAPAVDGLPPYGGFGEWDRLVRRPLVWAGLPDPLGGAELLRAVDPDLENTRALFTTWRDVFGNEPATAAEALARARATGPSCSGRVDPEHPAFSDAMHAVTGERLDGRRLAAWLRRHRGRIVDGLQLVRGEDDRHAKVARWAVTPAGFAGSAVSLSPNVGKVS